MLFENLMKVWTLSPGHCTQANMCMVFHRVSGIQGSPEIKVKKNMHTLLYGK